MALIQPSIDPFTGMLTLEAPGMSVCKVAPTFQGSPCSVGVWNDAVLAVDQGIEAENWITEYLSEPCLCPPCKGCESLAAEELPTLSTT